jgi:uncharacterized oligopeptide transporter (OPT) family protein
MAAGSGAIFKLMLSGLRTFSRVFRGSTLTSAIARSDSSASTSRPPCSASAFIVGIQHRLPDALGGALSWWVFIPFYNNFMIDQNPRPRRRSSSGLSAAGRRGPHLGASRSVYIGVGAMLIGGLWSLVVAAGNPCSPASRPACP